MGYGFLLDVLWGKHVNLSPRAHTHKYVWGVQITQALSVGCLISSVYSANTDLREVSVHVQLILPSLAVGATILTEIYTFNAVESIFHYPNLDLVSIQHFAKAS